MCMFVVCCLSSWTIAPEGCCVISGISGRRCCASKSRFMSCASVLNYTAFLFIRASYVISSIKLFNAFLFLLLFCFFIFDSAEFCTGMEMAYRTLIDQCRRLEMSLDSMGKERRAWFIQLIQRSGIFNPSILKLRRRRWPGHTRTMRSPINGQSKSNRMSLNHRGLLQSWLCCRSATLWPAAAAAAAVDCSLSS